MKLQRSDQSSSKTASNYVSCQETEEVGNEASGSAQAQGGQDNLQTVSFPLPRFPSKRPLQEIENVDAEAVEDDNGEDEQKLKRSRRIVSIQ